MGFRLPWSKKTEPVPLEIKLIVPSFTDDKQTLDWDRCCQFARTTTSARRFSAGGKKVLTMKDGGRYVLFIIEAADHARLTEGAPLTVSKQTIYCLLDNLNSATDLVYHQSLKRLIESGSFKRSPQEQTSISDHCAPEFLTYHAFNRKIF